MKAIVKRVFGIALLSFFLSFMFGLRRYNLWESTDRISASDIGVLVSMASIFIQSILGLFVSNFDFLGQGKNWEDFWTGNTFEYLYKFDEKIADPWRVARGKFILYLIICILSFGLVVIYFNIRK